MRTMLVMRTRDTNNNTPAISLLNYNKDLLREFYFATTIGKAKEFLEVLKEKDEANSEVYEQTLTAAKALWESMSSEDRIAQYEEPSEAKMAEMFGEKEPSVETVANAVRVGGDDVPDSPPPPTEELGNGTSEVSERGGGGNKTPTIYETTITYTNGGGLYSFYEDYLLKKYRLCDDEGNILKNYEEFEAYINSKDINEQNIPADTKITVKYLKKLSESSNKGKEKVSKLNEKESTNKKTTGKKKDSNPNKNGKISFDKEFKAVYSLPISYKLKELLKKTQYKRLNDFYNALKNSQNDTSSNLGPNDLEIEFKSLLKEKNLTPTDTADIISKLMRFNPDKVKNPSSSEIKTEAKSIISQNPEVEKIISSLKENGLDISIDDIVEGVDSILNRESNKDSMWKTIDGKVSPLHNRNVKYSDLEKEFIKKYGIKPSEVKKEDERDAYVSRTNLKLNFEATSNCVGLFQINLEDSSNKDYDKFELITNWKYNLNASIDKIVKGLKEATAKWNTLKDSNKKPVKLTKANLFRAVYGYYNIGGGNLISAPFNLNLLNKTPKESKKEAQIKYSNEVTNYFPD